MRVFFLFANLFTAVAVQAAPSAIPWDHTPFYFLNEKLPIEVTIREFPMLTAGHWRVCRAMRKQAQEVLEAMNNPTLNGREILLKHEFKVLWSICEVHTTGQSVGRGALRTRNFGGDVTMAAVTPNFVPGFNKARSVEIILLQANESEKLAELSPGTVFDIPYLRERKELRLTQVANEMIEQFVRGGQNLRFRINSGFPSQYLELSPADFSRRTEKPVVGLAVDETCAKQMGGDR